MPSSRFVSPLDVCRRVVGQPSRELWTKHHKCIYTRCTYSRSLVAHNIIYSHAHVVSVYPIPSILHYTLHCKYMYIYIEYKRLSALSKHIELCAQCLLDLDYSTYMICEAGLSDLISFGVRKINQCIVCL